MAYLFFLSSQIELGSLYLDFKLQIFIFELSVDSFNLLNSGFVAFNLVAKLLCFVSLP